jgi:hypothetical protein
MLIYCLFHRTDRQLIALRIREISCLVIPLNIQFRGKFVDLFEVCFGSCSKFLYDEPFIRKGFEFNTM